MCTHCILPCPGIWTRFWVWWISLPLLSYLIEQSYKYCADGIKVPNQVTSNKQKADRFWVSLTKSGALWKEESQSTRVSPAGLRGPTATSWGGPCAGKSWLTSESWAWVLSDSQENGHLDLTAIMKRSLPKSQWAWKRMPSLRWTHSPGRHLDFNLVKPSAEDLVNLLLDSWLKKTVR